MQGSLPSQIEVLEESGEYVIRRNWRSPRAPFLLGMCLFWDSVLVVWVLMLKAGGGFADGFGWEWIPALGHAMIGMGFTYYTLASFLNKTDVRVSPTSLTVNIHPLKWPGGGCFPLEMIRQIFVRERPSRSHNGRGGSYEVRFLDQRGVARTLVMGLETVEQARSIEAELESLLGIRNKPISGEVV